MASGGFCPHRSLCWNLPLLDPVEDQLARDPGPTGDLHLDSISLVPSCNLTSGPALIPAPVPACNVVTRDQLTGPRSSRFDTEQYPNA